MVFNNNKQINFSYEILETFTAGISLLGPEVKSIREKHISLKESFVKIKDGEAFLVQCHIAKPTYMDSFTNFNETRERKLLLTKKEIRYLGKEIEQAGLTVMSLRCFQPEGCKNIKLEIALCKGKHTYDKRETLKRRSQDMDAKRDMKNY